MSHPVTIQVARAIAAAALLVTAAASTGCAHLRNAETVCPEYRGLRCATAPECSYDKARGCEVCRCAKPPYAPPDVPYAPM